LYLTGLHLEQYRHATYDPCDYYLEALRRDPKESRCNNALGLWYMRHSQFAKAERHFRKAIETITQYNPNPIDGEPYYNLGLVLRYQNKEDEAFDQFYKSVWNAASMETGYFQLAQIAAKKLDWDEALDLIDRSLLRNWHNHKTRHLKVAILRKLGIKEEAEQLIIDSLKLDPFNFGVLFEKYLLHPDSVTDLSGLTNLIQNNIHTYIEFALDLASAGLYKEAIYLINMGIDKQTEYHVFPMAYYYKAWFEHQLGDSLNSTATLKDASSANPDYCFPNQTEAVIALEWAKKKNPKDAKAPYYLGNFWYSVRQYPEAVENWELSVKLDDGFPTVHRNLALAYFNKQNDSEKALAELEKAFRLDLKDARILMELDQLYKRLNYPPSKRLENLARYPDLVKFRDDLYLEQITLYNLLANHEEALKLIMSRRFHPWEGGEGKVTSQYVFSLTELAKKAISVKKFDRAVDLLTHAMLYPENLGEGKLYGAQENAIFYWLGCAYNGLGNPAKSNECWQIASKGISEPEPAIFYNDQQPDTIFYQGLALNGLDRKDEARQRFDTLIRFGQAHLDDVFKLDYFAVSMPDLQIWNDDLTKRNRQNCLHLIELGKQGYNLLENDATNLPG
jgi:tetratricopeptide (TPR) repeat protein